MQSKILIIEDDQELAAALHDILELDTHEVLVANTGRNGLEIALKEHPDLLILDIKMPDLDGYEVFQRLSTDGWGKNAKVMVLTASESIENISKNINLPKKYVLFKPEVSVQELRTIVKQRLAE